MDVHDRTTRSYNMSRIRGSKTKPEEAVAAICRTLGRRYYRNYKELPGKPDFYFPKLRLAVFVNGCFWHSHDCRNGRKRPVTNSEFWDTKRKVTIARDATKRQQLEKIGITVMNIWECEINDKESVLQKLTAAVSNFDT